jgi:hypothetical protein
VPVPELLGLMAALECTFVDAQTFGSVVVQDDMGYPDLVHREKSRVCLGFKHGGALVEGLRTIVVALSFR